MSIMLGNPIPVFNEEVLEVVDTAIEDFNVDEESAFDSAFVHQGERLRNFRRFHGIGRNDAAKILKFSASRISSLERTANLEPRRVTLMMRALWKFKGFPG